jgi:hypothetical protein
MGFGVPFGANNANHEIARWTRIIQAANVKTE